MIQVLVALFKAIPAITEIANKFVELWLYSQDKIDEKNAEKLKIKREAIFKSLQNKDLTNEERSELRRMLFDLNKLPNSTN